MTSRISKGSITGRAAFSNGGLGLSIGSKVSGGIRHAISRRAPDASKIAGAAAAPIYKLIMKGTNFGTIMNYETNVSSFPHFTTRGFSYADSPAVSLFAPFKIEYFESITILTASTKYAEITNVDESLIKSTAIPNVYTITIPAISTTDGDWTNVSDTRWVLTNNLPAGFGPITIDNGTDFAGASSLITSYLSGKTYTFTMTGTDTFTISGNGVTPTSFEPHTS